MASRSQIPSATAHQHQTQQASSSFTPNFDVLETEHEYILEGELPGLHDKKQTVIEFTDAQTILIRGRIERDVEGEEKKGNLKATVGEGRVGAFQRNFTFPGSIDVDAVRATLDYGVLRIVVPKLVKARARRIEIQ
ncbi:HSP20-like chaperone [Tuber magnatum]|uniref:HSP20-like chaperone n=1 Tax=Tuber magnatum TaxID=42249 RepID=A0A317SGD6_9PEZI|nr:HSP20-like chaperone [Tuber magnatum]